MRMYEITYIRTGSGEKRTTSKCAVSTCDYLKNGERVNDLMGVVAMFEEYAEEWGSYENRNAITEIKLVYEA